MGAFHIEPNPLKHLFNVHPLAAVSSKPPRNATPKIGKIQVVDKPIPVYARSTPGVVNTPALAREAARTNTEIARANRPVPQPIYYIPGDDGSSRMSFAAPRPTSEEVEGITPSPEQAQARNAGRQKELEEWAHARAERDNDIMARIEAEHTRRMAEEAGQEEAAEAGRKATADALAAKQNREAALNHIGRKAARGRDEASKKDLRESTHPMLTRGRKILAAAAAAKAKAAAESEAGKGGQSGRGVGGSVSGGVPSGSGASGSGAPRHPWEPEEQFDEGEGEGEGEGEQSPPQSIAPGDWLSVMKGYLSNVNDYDVKKLLAEGYKPVLVRGTVRLFNSKGSAKLPVSLVNKYGGVTVNNKAHLKLPPLKGKGGIPYEPPPQDGSRPPP